MTWATHLQHIFEGGVLHLLLLLLLLLSLLLLLLSLLLLLLLLLASTVYAGKFILISPRPPFQWGFPLTKIHLFGHFDWELVSWDPKIVRTSVQIRQLLQSTPKHFRKNTCNIRTKPWLIVLLVSKLTSIAIRFSKTPIASVKGTKTLCNLHNASKQGIVGCTPTNVPLWEIPI